MRSPSQTQEGLENGSERGYRCAFRVVPALGLEQRCPAFSNMTGERPAHGHGLFRWLPRVEPDIAFRIPPADKRLVA
jgi:hypothetical protein